MSPSDDFYFGESYLYGNDPMKISIFLEWLKGFISKIVETGTDQFNNPLFANDLRLYMIRAWAEIDPHFESVMSALEHTDIHILASHGLIGKQLEYKLKTINYILDKFNEHGGKSLFYKLLEATDNLLGSIIGVLGVGNAIVEFKDTLKSSIE